MKGRPKPRCTFCGVLLGPDHVGSFCCQEHKDRQRAAYSNLDTVVTMAVLSSAKTKPRGVSDIRWKIELKRRALHGRRFYEGDSARIYRVELP